jgi:hypothetical protein
LADGRLARVYALLVGNVLAGRFLSAEGAMVPFNFIICGSLDARYLKRHAKSIDIHMFLGFLDGVRFIVRGDDDVFRFGYVFFTTKPACRYVDFCSEIDAILLHDSDNSKKINEYAACYSARAWVLLGFEEVEHYAKGYLAASLSDAVRPVGQRGRGKVYFLAYPTEGFFLP